MKRHRLLVVFLVILLLAGLGGTAAALCTPSGTYTYCEQVGVHHTSAHIGQSVGCGRTGTAWSCETGSCMTANCSHHPVYEANCAFGCADHAQNDGWTHHTVSHHTGTHHHK